MWWAIILSVAITIVLLWAFFTAQRLNRMHIRTDAARHNLCAALDRRAAVIAATIPELAEQASSAEQLGLLPENLVQRCEAEADLARALTAVHDDCQHPIALRDAEVRVELAQRFYNQAVTDTRALRTRPAIRMLGLAGTAPLPAFAELPLAASARLSDRPPEDPEEVK